MNIIPAQRNEHIKNFDNTLWESKVEPVDNFSITEWPGRVEDTSIICDVAVQRPEVPLSSFVDALIPYSKPHSEGIGFFEVFELDKTDTDESIRDIRSLIIWFRWPIRGCLMHLLIGRRISYRYAVTVTTKFIMEKIQPG